jgi:uncharacterized membrane protein
MVIFNASEWINLIVRWTHVFSAILWVGTTYYFTWLDMQLRRAEKSGGQVWMVHSGGFYTVVKQKTLGVPPSDVHWFRWESMVTWVSGMTLLMVVYYAGGLIVDASDPTVSEHLAKIVGVSALIIGWVVYDLLVRTPLVRAGWAFGIVALILIVALAWGLRQVMSARATYIHVGALFGTIMASNVWMRILPPQRRMIAAAARGEGIDPGLGTGAKERSTHNTFIVVPTVFLMISNHFPTATYGNRYALATMAVLIVAGWCAAAVLRKGPG